MNLDIDKMSSEELKEFIKQLIIVAENYRERMDIIQYRMLELEKKWYKE